MHAQRNKLPQTQDVRRTTRTVSTHNRATPNHFPEKQTCCSMRVRNTTPNLSQLAVLVRQVSRPNMHFA